MKKTVILSEFFRKYFPSVINITESVIIITVIKIPYTVINIPYTVTALS